MMQAELHLPLVEIAEVPEKKLLRDIWEESQKLWRIAGPAIFSRVAMYGMNSTSQAIAGHLDNLDLAAISIASVVILGLSYGFLLGMGSSLETICGQAYGAGQYDSMGVYLQKSWILLFAVGVLVLPMFIFATPILKLTGQPDDVAELGGTVAIWLIPQHFAYVFLFPMMRFLQCQLKNAIITWFCLGALIANALISWVVVFKLKMGLFGLAMSLNVAWWIPVIGLFAYVTCGHCPLSWHGFSCQAFSDMWPFFKLSVASGVMLCLEFWYYRILVLLTGNLKDPEIAIDALSISNNLNAWESMIHLGFFVAIGVRIANELGSGRARGAKFAAIVAVVTSGVFGLVFAVIIFIFNDSMALVFTNSKLIQKEVSKMSILLALSILLNGIQPVLSGVAVGSGWQSIVAYVNIGCYYFIGIPLGVILGWSFNLGVQGIWGGMICGTTVQTLVLCYLTYRCDWNTEVVKALCRVKSNSSSFS